MRKYVFIGNCQIDEIKSLYVRYASKSHEEHIHYIRSYENLSDADRVYIEFADVIVEQVQDFLPKISLAGIETKAQRIGIPVIHCGFLWPFAGQPHPNNPSPPFLRGGPYGTEMSDAYLNRLIRKNTPGETAVKNYLDLDINQLVNLDRLYEIVIEKQIARDQLTGFKIAEIIQNYFKTEQIFFSPYHPNVRVAAVFISQAFEKLGVSVSDIAAMRRSMRISPFPKDELPIHPGVARHFDLQWASSARRYRLLNEGSYTFTEFAHRYMNCEWNEAMAHGLSLSQQGEWEQARSYLTSALEISPNAAAGHSALAYVLERLGSPAEALAAIRQAVALDPNSPGYRAQLAQLLQGFNDLRAAEQEFRSAAILDPYNAHWSDLLAGFLLRASRFDEALVVAQNALALSPRAANLLSVIGHAQFELGAPEAAEAAYMQAAALAPATAGPLMAIAARRERDGRLDDSIELVQAALEREPHNAHVADTLARLVTLGNPSVDAALILADTQAEVAAANYQLIEAVRALLRAGKTADAIGTARRIFDHPPLDFKQIHDIARAFESHDHLDEAVAFLQAALAMTPDSDFLTIQLGDALVRSGKFVEAEPVIRRAVMLSPQSAHVLNQLGYVLSQQGRFDEAIAAREAAVAIEPANPHRAVQLAHVLMAAGKLDAAQAAIQIGIDRMPFHPEFHLDLAQVNDRAGRIGEAITAAMRAVELDPEDPRGHVYLAALHTKRHDWDAAIASYRCAIERVPDDEHARTQMNRLLIATGGRTDSGGGLAAASR